MILNIFILFILSIFSGICEAIMDTINFNYYGSIFKKLNPNFWNRELSSNNKNVSGSKFKKMLFKTVLVFLTDAWHLFKTLHTFSLLLIVIFVHYFYINVWIFIIALILTYMMKKLVFELFYNIFFKK